MDVPTVVSKVDGDRLSAPEGIAHCIACVCDSRDWTTCVIHDHVELGATPTDWTNVVNNSYHAERTVVMNFRGE